MNREPLVLLTAIVVGSILMASPARAQDACTSAAQHLSDCAAQVCSLEGQPGDCVGHFSGFGETLGEVCDAEMAAFVLRSTCFTLSESYGIGAGSGNICVTAMEYYMGCITAFCADQEGNPVCEMMLEADVAELAREMECAGSVLEESEDILRRSCESITADFMF